MLAIETLRFSIITHQWPPHFAQSYHRIEQVVPQCNEEEKNNINFSSFTWLLRFHLCCPLFSVFFNGISAVLVGNLFSALPLAIILFWTLLLFVIRNSYLFITVINCSEQIKINKKRIIFHAFFLLFVRLLTHSLCRVHSICLSSVSVAFACANLSHFSMIFICDFVGFVVVILRLWFVIKIWLCDTWQWQIVVTCGEQKQCQFQNFKISLWF